MRRIAIISINGVANVGGVERVVADHQRALSEIATVKLFSLPPWRSIRGVRIVNALLTACFAMVSSSMARVWAGPKGVVMSHGYSSIGMFCDLVFAHGCWAGYVEKTGNTMGKFGRIIYTVEWLAAHLAHRIIGVSDRVIDQWTHYYGMSPARSMVLLNSVQTHVFYPQPGAEDPCVGNELHVLFVGRFELGKGMLYLSTLHNEIIFERSRVHLVICSPTAVQETIIQQYPLFEFKYGLSPEQVAEEYSRADMFLLPSLYEAFELSSIEALACGTPVLLNDTGARPTLEMLSCPGVFRLEEADSPLRAVRQAAERFRGLPRLALAAWTQKHFGGQNLRLDLLRLCGIEGAAS